MRLEQIQRDFLWGGGALERKPHLVDWSIVCSDKPKGDLGVRNLALLNKALLCKWSWHFAVEREALWRQVICAKYGEEEGGWRSCVVRGSFGVGLWKAIRRVWDVIGDNMVYSVRNDRGLDFGRTSGVETILCVFLFPLYLSYPWLRRLRWRICGAILEGKCGLLGSLGGLMIGKCSMWSIFS